MKKTKHTSFTCHPAWIISAFSFIVSANSMLNRFFVRTVHYDDDALLTYLFAQSNVFPVKMQRAHYFSTHFSPFLCLSQILCTPLKSLDPFVVFGLFLAFFYALTSFCTTYILLHPHHAFFPDNPKKSTQVAALMGLLTALSPSITASIGFPHWEMIIITMGLASYTCWLYHRKTFSVLCFLFGLSIREDAGFHYFSVIFLVFLWHLFKENNLFSQKVKKSLTLSLFCFLYSVIALFIQKKYYQGDDALKRIYLGEQGIFSHLNFAVLQQRLIAFFYYKKTMSLPLTMGIFFFFIPKLRPLSIGSFSCLPWTMLSLLAHNPVAAELGIYYSFPLMTAFLWPLLWPLDSITKKHFFKIRVAFLALLFTTVITDHHSRYLPTHLFRWNWIKPWITTRRFAPKVCQAIDQAGLFVDEQVFALCFLFPSKNTSWIDLTQENPVTLEQKIAEKGLVFKAALKEKPEWMSGLTPHRFELCKKDFLDFQFVIPSEKLNVISPLLEIKCHPLKEL